MNLLHAFVAALIENFPAVLGVLSACFNLGIFLSCFTVAGGVAASAYSLLRRPSHPAVILNS